MRGSDRALLRRGGETLEECRAVLNGAPYRPSIATIPGDNRIVSHRAIGGARFHSHPQCAMPRRNAPSASTRLPRQQAGITASILIPTLRVVGYATLTLSVMFWRINQERSNGEDAIETQAVRL